MTQCHDSNRYSVNGLIVFRKFGSGSGLKVVKKVKPGLASTISIFLCLGF